MKIIRILLMVYMSGNNILALYHIITGTTDEKLVAGGYFCIGSIGLCACLIGCKHPDDVLFRVAHAISGLFVFVVTINGLTLQSYFPLKYVLSTEKTGMQGVDSLGNDLVAISLMIVLSIPEIRKQYKVRKEAKKYDYVAEKFNQ